MNLVSRRNLLAGTSAAVMAPIVAKASPIAAAPPALKKCHVTADKVTVTLDGTAGVVLSGQTKQTICLCTDFNDGGKDVTEVTLPFGKPVLTHRPKLRIERCDAVRVTVSTIIIDVGGHKATTLKIAVTGTRDGGTKQASLSKVWAECCIFCDGALYCSEGPWCMVCDDMVYCCA